MSGRTNFKNILIVDDSKTSRLILTKAFMKAGYMDSTYYEAADGAEAMSIVHENHINLIVTDIRMPNMDGEAFIRQLRSVKSLSDIPVIIVSSSSNVALSETFKGENILGYTLKPVTPEKIINTVESIYDLVNLENKLIASTNETFSKLYDFSSGSVHSAAESDYEPGLIMTVSFSKPLNGRLILMVSMELLDRLRGYLEENELPSSDKDLEDSVKETLNVLCGNFLVQYFGPDKEIKVSLPLILDNLFEVEELDLMHEFEIDIEKQPATLLVSMEGMSQSY